MNEIVNFVPKFAPTLHYMKRNIIAILLLLSALSSFSQSRIYVNEYLNIGVGGRGLSMAGAQSASSQDIYSTYWNPAGLASLDQKAEVGLMHAEYFAGIFKYDFGAAALRLKDGKRTLGISIIRFATDNIPYTLDYVQPDGSFDESKLKSFSAGDYAFALSYAQQLGWFKKKANHEAQFGANLKMLYRNVGKMANAWGAGVDLGLQIKANRWRFGFMARDITTTVTSWSFHLTEKEKEEFTKTGNEIPIKSYEVMNPRLNLGIGRYFMKPEKPFQIMAELGLDMTTDGKRIALISGNPISIDPRIGMELSYKHTIFLRGGISNMYNALDNSDSTNQKTYFVYQPAVGVGFKLKQLSIDYAFTSLNMQNSPLYSHVVSLKIGFKGKRKAEVEAEPVPSPQPPVNNPNPIQQY